ncbi:MAG: universal stress protein [Pseudomonadota bacterium]
MTPSIKKILYATDLSENARYAFSYAADLAQKYDAKLTILSVLENMSPFAETQVQQIMGIEKWKQLKS